MSSMPEDPDVRYLNALLFPVGSSTPQAIRIPYIEEEDIEWPFSNTPSYKLDYSAWFGAEPQSQIVEKELTHHACTGHSLSRTLLVLYEDCARLVGGGSKEFNSCVEAMTGGACRGWKGNVVVVRAVEPTSTLTQYSDAAQDDIEPVVAWLKQSY